MHLLREKKEIELIDCMSHNAMFVRCMPQPHGLMIQAVHAGYTVSCIRHGYSEQLGARHIQTNGCCCYPCIRTVSKLFPYIYIHTRRGKIWKNTTTVSVPVIIVVQQFPLEAVRCAARSPVTSFATLCTNNRWIAFKGKDPMGRVVFDKPLTRMTPAMWQVRKLFAHSRRLFTPCSRNHSIRGSQSVVEKSAVVAVYLSLPICVDRRLPLRQSALPAGSILKCIPRTPCVVKRNTSRAGAVQRGRLANEV